MKSEVCQWLQIINVYVFCLGIEHGLLVRQMSLIGLVVIWRNRQSPHYWNVKYDINFSSVLHRNNVGVLSLFIADTYGEDSENHCKYGSNFYQCCEYKSSCSAESQTFIMTAALNSNIFRLPPWIDWHMAWQFVFKIFFFVKVTVTHFINQIQSASCCYVMYFCYLPSSTTRGLLNVTATSKSDFLVWGFLVTFVVIISLYPCFFQFFLSGSTWQFLTGLSTKMI